MRRVLLVVAGFTGCAYPDFGFGKLADSSIGLGDTSVIDATLDTTIEPDSAVADSAPVDSDLDAINANDTAPLVDSRDTSVADTSVADTSVVDTAGTLVTLASRGGSWRYLDDGTAPPSTSWRGGGGFDDSKWKSGPAQLGFGDGDEKTVITRGVPLDAGPDADADAPPPFLEYTSYYFRRFITVTDAAGFDQITFRVLRDDGAVVYLNGVEVVRTNMPSGTITNSTLASTTVSGVDEDMFYVFVIPAATLKEGSNVIAVEVHQSGPSSDISFDLELIGHKP